MSLLSLGAVLLLIATLYLDHAHLASVSSHILVRRRRTPDTTTDPAPQDEAHEGRANQSTVETAASRVRGTQAPPGTTPPIAMEALPAFKGHYILGLSREALLSTSPFDMMQRYTFPLQEVGNCDADFGNKLVSSWRATKATACSNNGADGLLASSLHTHLMHQVDRKHLQYLVYTLRGVLRRYGCGS